MRANDKLLNKLRTERKEDLIVLIEYAKHTSLTDIIYLMTLIHLNRILRIDKSKSEFISKFFVGEFKYSIEDTLIYLVSLCAKYGKKQLTDIRKTNFRLIAAMIEGTNQMYSKYTYEPVIELYEIEETADSFILKSNYRETIGNELIKYATRVDQYNEVKSRSVDVETLLLQMHTKFNKFEDLILSTYHTSLKQYKNFVRSIAKSFSDKVFSQIHILQGMVDITDTKVLEAYQKCFVFSYEELQGYAKSDNIIHTMSFVGNDFKEGELKFQYMNRRPIIFMDNKYCLICPQILMNSILWSLHFGLLENQNIRESYKARQSDYFLDRVSNIARNAGYYEVDRNLKVRYKGEDLGDYDLILKNDDDDYLVVEGKNERLPLDVYFGFLGATIRRFEETKAWEKKVQKRYEYLINNSDSLGISQNYKYILVSEYPEVISHFSRYLMLSINEFEQWVSWGLPELSFSEIYSHLYSKTEDVKANIDINLLNDLGYSLIKIK